MVLVQTLEDRQWRAFGLNHPRINFGAIKDVAVSIVANVTCLARLSFDCHGTCFYIGRCLLQARNELLGGSPIAAAANEATVVLGILRVLLATTFICLVVPGIEAAAKVDAKAWKGFPIVGNGRETGSEKDIGGC